MVFEVKRDGRVYMQCSDPRCVPDKETRRQMRAAGYKLYLDGKAFKEVP